MNRQPGILERIADRATNLITTPSGKPEGPDLSRWRVPVDYGQCSAVDFAIWKVSEADFKDAWADYHAEHSHKATDIRMGFLYDNLAPRFGATLNVQTYIRHARPYGLNAHWVDVEPYDRNAPYAREYMTPARLLSMLNRLQEAFPDELVGYYTSWDGLVNYLKRDERLIEWPLWLSSPYRTRPAVPDGFSYFLWQKTFAHKWAGFKNLVNDGRADGVDWNEAGLERAEFRARLLPKAVDPDDEKPALEILDDMQHEVELHTAQQLERVEALRKLL